MSEPQSDSRNLLCNCGGQAALDVALAEVKRLKIYVAHLSEFAELRHPLGVSANECNDECLTAHAIKAGIEFRKSK